MGVRSSSVAPGDMAGMDIDRQLRLDRLKNLFMYKILLLGAGESGKSTVVKQLRLIHNKKPNTAELAMIAASLHQNVLDCIKSLIFACKKFNIALGKEESKIVDEIMEFKEGKNLSYEFGQRIQTLYKSDPIKAAYARRDEFWLLDSCSYYMKNLDRFTEPAFEPSEEDQVMARIRTTGIVESDLEEKLRDPPDIEGGPDKIIYKVVDVGGQRNERRKWMHCFDDVACILYIVNLGGYNQVLFEDTKKNRMMESLELINDISNKAQFANTPIFIFCNKKDLFEACLREKPLSSLFPEYKTTNPTDVQEALTFIHSQFEAQLPVHKRGSNTPFFDVTGVYKKDIKYAFDDIKNILRGLNKAGVDKMVKDILKQTKKSDKKRARAAQDNTDDPACCGCFQTGC